MTQMRFLLEMHERLSVLPEEEIEERLAFYISLTIISSNLDKIAQNAEE